MSEMEMRQIAGEINMCPSSTPGTVPNTDVLFQRIEELSRNGLAYITHRPLDDALGTTPADAVLDVFLILQGMPVLVLTLLMNKYQCLDKVSAYNLALTDRIAKAFKEVSPEQFSVLNGVMLESDISSEVHFENFIHNILKDNYKHLDLVVSEEKYKCIITTFLSSLALTSSIVDKDNCDALWFLSLQKFCMVTETIEKKAVIVKIKPTDGSKALMGDVVGTLKTLGSTFVVIESEEAPGSGEPTPAAR
ncbi:uncharacterized protein LOC124151262 [Haliotis rufescens]|uniref:uncharacterized protein LOC124151262 n=1 Tax=Haliotis rufescens TaxID=6454 RepID=UPI00201EEFFB|nr:uncharacterized protein LOC124151262 [Haliotis rufescens]